MSMIKQGLRACRVGVIQASFFVGLGVVSACSSNPTVRGTNGDGERDDQSDTRADGGTTPGGGQGNVDESNIIGVGDNDASTSTSTCKGDDCEEFFGDAGPACGDGQIDDGEECDDGNSAPGDGCNGQCQVEPYSECPKAGEPCRSTIKCGDGKVSPGEVCDDGNNDDDDGCSKDCINQDASYYCPTPGEPCKRLFDCGDGRVNGSDECDDGNTDSGDGCAADCKKEDGFTCRQPGHACTPAEKCGNGQIDDDEECDDGGLVPGDGCSGICTQEPYWMCSGTTCESTIVCGNGVKDPGETCDDGNEAPFDGCDAECQQDPNYVCEVNEPCLKIVDCGDGKVAGDEACDDGNKDDDDGCTPACEREEGYTCPAPGEPCEVVEYCGDGRLQLGEECDDGDVARNDSNVWNDGCSGICTLETFFSCGTAGQACMSTVICGNGELEPGEECDDGSNVDANDGCNSNCLQDEDYLCLTVGAACTPIQTCGDSLITGTEECDDGDTQSDDGCSSACQVEGEYVCATPGEECILPRYCGDGNIDMGEECDDGDVVRNDPDVWGDGCSGVCTVETYFTCATPGQPCETTIECGNGELEPGEECDDGSNLDDNDGCNNECVQDLEFLCNTVGEACTQIQTCGDGQVTGSEECDDNDLDPGNGCSEICETEAGWACSTPGAACIEIQFCGDGVLNAGEQCDDGDAVRNDGVVWNDGCSGVCTLESYFSCATPGQACVSTIACGNGVLEPGEECDDASNVNPNDGCDNSCDQDPAFLCATVGVACVRIQTCGDGLVTGTEECDDSDLDTNNGCTAECEISDDYICPTPGEDCYIPFFCGDGALDQGEECDDGDVARNDLVIWNDGCSGNCQLDDHFECDTPGQACVSTIECGNGEVEPGEYCDDGDTSDGDGCEGNCRSKTPGYVCSNNVCTRLLWCGDGKVSRSLGETCDDGNDTNASDGCHACALDPDYRCPTPNAPCSLKPVCGDGNRDPGEQCDHNGAINAGCESDCTFTPNWLCDADGANCAQLTCGDGIISAAEACDDGNLLADDGCNADCSAIEEGFTCVRAGYACRAICGDGLRRGLEACDDGDTTGSDGCSSTCAREAGYACTTPDGDAGVGDAGVGDAGAAGSVCVLSVCGNGTTEGDEGCDDGNDVAGDGCSSTCQNEPTFVRDPLASRPVPVPLLRCGDGLITDTTNGQTQLQDGGTSDPIDEACDDGNTIDGDGCSSTCQVEDGYTCSELLNLPGTVKMSVTYRDFKTDESPGGHPDFERPTAAVDSIPGAACTSVNEGTCGHLDDEGKPVLDGSKNTIQSADSFALWFRGDYSASNPGAEDPNPSDSIVVDVIEDNLTLTQQGGATSQTYQYESNTHFPLNGLGLGNICNGTVPTQDLDGSTCCNNGGACQNRNFHFTTELRYFFKYTGGETLTFRGDDDVWVFVNGHLAVDIGGTHCAQGGRIVLGDEDGDCTLHRYDTNGACGNTGTLPTCVVDSDPGYDTNEQADDTDARFGLTKGGVYEIVLFHAERHTVESNFQLTLAGFLAPRSFCEPVCGDGFVTPDEECDDGDDNAGTPGSPVYNTCTTSCTLELYCGDANQNGDEACDNGTNRSSYGDTTPTACAAGCVAPPTCGDSIINGSEACDDGLSNGVDDGYNGCTELCAIGPSCGDGDINGDETCDDGVNDGSYGSCNSDCTPGPRCGDTNIDTAQGEECDSTAGCSNDCVLLCGNGVLDGSETCDDGVNDGSYAGCSSACTRGPRCGDGTPNAPYETCDQGTGSGLNDGGYGECDATCHIGQFCGDGVTNGPEDCDDRINVGGYNRCAPGCVWGPKCGDGSVDTDWGEQCDPLDPSTGDNCTNQCKIICGDGVVDDGEECDDRINGGGYGRCEQDCTMGPTCGDGITTEPYEVCDEGSGSGLNDGGYGQCTEFCQIAEFCGDGVVNGTEQCDDHVNVGGYNRCGPGCVAGPRCGDGAVQTQFGEQCDPEDAATGDNCTETCKIRCGNGILDVGEECDDRINAGGYNRCQEDCTMGPTCGDGEVEEGYEVCDEGPGDDKNDGGYMECTAFCQVAEFCGDGVVNGTEACDDRVNVGGYNRCAPGCVMGPTCGDGTTQTQYGEQCDKNDPDPAKAANCSSTCKLLCGNGRLDGEEQCDDGLARNVGGYGHCNANCTMGPKCGDGLENAPYEGCDEGAGADKNNGGYDQCSAFCQIAEFCGDGIKNGPEQCDDRVNDGGYRECAPGCVWGERCGDGVVQANWGELCDPADPDPVKAAKCTSTCKLKGTCGDGIRQTELGEECDDGANTGAYGFCAPECQWGPRCGDGVVQATEECDDGTEGNDGEYGGCTNTCRYAPRCGDGEVDEDNGESCDDGINDNTYGSCAQDCTPGPRCGDGDLQDEWGEQCDGEANCSDNCRLGAMCGDGQVQKDLDEECDDGKNDGGYGECAPMCKQGPRCGDGVTQPGEEQCDDGKNDGGYGECFAGCKVKDRCGDGVLQSDNEQCDDGNTVATDSCSNQCKFVRHNTF